MKKITLFLIILFITISLNAQEEGMTSSGELVLQLSTLPEAKLGYTHTFRFPVLQGDNSMTESNNFKLHLTAEVSPISLNGIVKAVLTPIAFLEFSAGARAGAGWPLNLFGSDIYGTGLNIQGTSLNAHSAGYTAEYKGSAFDALLWKAWLGGTFQFDLAALVPGDWNHIVFLTYHEINYHANTSAKANEGWYFENDDGENLNGFNYYGNFVLGYQMPIFLNMIAVLAEMNQNLYDTPGRSLWGDDLIRWHFSGIFNFTITEKFGIALIAQFRTRRNFIGFNEHKDEKPHLHFQNRILDKSDPLRLEFYRVAAIASYKF